MIKTKEIILNLAMRILDGLWFLKELLIQKELSMELLWKNVEMIH